MQGTAAAYDLASHAAPERLSVLDVDERRALRSATRVNQLIGDDICQAGRLDAGDPRALRRHLDEFDAVLSCVPYRLHQGIARACLDLGVSCVDMGNDTDVTRETLSWDPQAKAKGVSIVPDCGLAPGLVNSLANALIETVPGLHTVRLYCGGLPQNPKPPLNYALAFSVEGLLGEYVDEAIALREGQIVRLDTLSELESVEVDGMGRLEAFTTSSGTSTAPWTRQSLLRNYEYKTLRYPGHCAIMQAFRHYGFWDEEPVRLGDLEVAPVRLWLELMGERLSDPEYRDVVVTKAVGVSDDLTVELDLVERHDEATGFSAMERLTGFSTAIMAQALADGAVPTGCVPYELALSGEEFLRRLSLRGIAPVRKETRTKTAN